MKQIIDIEVKTRKAEPVEFKTDMLTVGHFSDAKDLDKLNRELDRRLGGAVRRVIDLGDFRGKEGTCAVIYGGPPTAASRVLLVGLGEKGKAGLDTIRKAAACAANKAVALKVGQLGLALHKSVGGRFRPEAMGRALAEGVWFGGYRYDEFVTGDENGRPDSLKAQLIDPDAGKIRSLGKGVTKGAIIGRAQSYARTLANRPANIISPAGLAAAATKLTREAKNLTCTVFDEKQMAAKQMGGVLAVGSGSKNRPRFIVIKYSPGRKPPKNRPTVALVGKAITFDSGGLSIKPAPGMQQMKLDKTGGVAVLGAMMAVSQLQLALNVLGIIPAAENLPSGTSYRPGDIVTTFGGKTVEVQNTDAEGRMILCDGLGYAVKQNCDVLIDIATLTGACRVALGNYMAGLMSNNDRLSKQLQQASDESGEKVWPMPSGDEYAEEIKSKIADLKNIGSKFGGACTAAAFLRQFVADKKWAHLDIAGVEAFEKATAFTAEGSSGFGVRLLVTYLMSLCG